MTDPIHDENETMTESLDTRLDIGQHTFVRVGTVIAIGFGLWTTYSWLDSRFKAVEGGVSASSIRMDDAMRRIEAATADQWTRTDQRLFLLELALRNRTLNIPTVAETKTK